MRKNKIKMGKPNVTVADEYGNPKSGVSVTWRKAQPWEQVDWVELGCRGWHIDETGAGLILPHPAPGPNFAHVDLETLNIALCGDGAFLRRVYHDLAAAGVPGMVEWVMTTFPRTATTNVITSPSTVDWWVSRAYP